MDNIKEIIGWNLSELRKNRKMTLQELSELTGVSKSMLGEIERGTSSPTITVLWKIADGLKVPFTTLIEEEKPQFKLIKEMDMETFTEGNAYTISSIFKYDPSKNFEIYHIEFNPGGTHESKGHHRGIGEYILVYEGSLEIHVGDEKLLLRKGDSLFFQGEEGHLYKNPGNVTAKAYSIISYDKGAGV